jgi:RHS repeat-associated protein
MMSSTFTIWPMAELNAITGAWTRGEIYIGATHLGTYSSNKTYFSHANWLGTERIKTDETGVIAQNCTYNPFGDGENCTVGPIASPIRYAGYERDAETGLDHMWFRYYNPRLGRFMSADPISGEISNPQSLNKFGYVRNLPTNLTDPFGLCDSFIVITWMDPNGELRAEYVCFGSPSGGGGGGGGGSRYQPLVDTGLEQSGDFGGGRRSPGGPASAPNDPAQAAAEACREGGELSFNIPFTNIPVSLSLSATLLYPTFSSTNDIGLALGVLPPLSPSVGAGLDISVNAPDASTPQALAFVGVGRNLSIGTFLTPDGPKGGNLSIGPSVGAPVGVALPVTNACALRQKGGG